MPEKPTVEGPDYHPPAGAVAGGRIFFRSKKTPVYGCFEAS